MAVLRDLPYTQFNFLVDLGNGSTEGPSAGFSEVGPLETTVEVIEYRTGNARENGVRKLPGLSKTANVSLKRGVIGSLDLYAWLDAVRNGGQGARRTVTVHLQNEDHSEVVMSWKLIRAFPVKHAGPTLDATGNCVAIEEIVLACERIEIE